MFAVSQSITFFPRRRARALHGFTLIELAVALGIAGVLAALAVQSYSEQNRRRDADNAARQVGNLIEQARELAVANGTCAELTRTETSTSTAANPEYENFRIVQWDDCAAYTSAILFEQTFPIGRIQLDDTIFPSDGRLVFSGDGQTTSERPSEPPPGGTVVMFGAMAAMMASVACFTEDTLVITRRGRIPIVDVMAGDEVWAADPNSKVPSGWKKVTGVKETFDREVMEVTVATRFDVDTLQATREHPFFVIDRGWVLAGQLRVKDIVVTADGQPATVTHLARSRDRTNVYNLEVADLHTFFVGELGVLVHNQYMPPPSLPRPPSVRRFTVSTEFQDYGYTFYPTTGTVELDAP